MSIAKESVINKLYEIPDNIQNEMEVNEYLYKLIKLENSKMPTETDETLSTNDVREYFANKLKNREVTTIC